MMFRFELSSPTTRFDSTRSILTSTTRRSRLSTLESGYVLVFLSLPHNLDLSNFAASPSRPHADLSPSFLLCVPQEMIPFAVVGSQTNVIIDGKPVRGRKNRYGVVNVEDERHCEFVYLRNFLTRSVSISFHTRFVSFSLRLAFDLNSSSTRSSFADSSPFLVSLVCRTHLQDLIESTALNHYEAFRSKQVRSTSIPALLSNASSSFSSSHN